MLKLLIFTNNIIILKQLKYLLNINKIKIVIKILLLEFFIYFIVYNYY
jgi:hypothetical protein